MLLQRSTSAWYSCSCAGVGACKCMGGNGLVLTSWELQELLVLRLLLGSWAVWLRAGAGRVVLARFWAAAVGECGSSVALLLLGSSDCWQ